VCFLTLGNHLLPQNSVDPRKCPSPFAFSQSSTSRSFRSIEAMARIVLITYWNPAAWRLPSNRENIDMDLNMNSFRVIAFAVAIGTTGAFAQEPAAPPPHSEMMSGKMAGMGDKSMPMMAMHEKMMADMKAMDAQMDAKVAAMNAARGGAKTNAIAAVINEMVSQQKQMMARMMTMHNQMMEQMAHPDGTMKGMDMGKSPADIPKQ
jgi:hypothetical protein